MHERPIGDLVDALRALGCDIRYSARAGFPPLAIGAGRRRARAARCAIRGDVSSQFLTALLMALPLARRASARRRSTVDGELISQPYVEITLNLMRALRRRRRARRLARRFAFRPARAIASPGDVRRRRRCVVGVVFPRRGRAIGGGPVRVEGVGRDSIQGDVAFADVLARMGADVRFGDDWIEARAGRPLARRHDRLQRDSRRRDDARDRRAVRDGADDARATSAAGA